MSEAEVVPLTVTPEVLMALHAPTPEGARKQRQGPGGMMLTYVDARYVMQVLDSEVGPANWQDSYTMGAGGKVGCLIGIFVDQRGWVWKGDGAGATDIEGDKGSFSDAFKRAAVKWGIARDLYDEKPSAGVSAPAVVSNTPQIAPQNAPSAPQSAPAPAAPPDLPPNTVRYQDIDSETGGCPVHLWAWSVQPGGTSKAGKAYNPFYKCGGKTPEGRFCDQKPSKAWADAHPAA